MLLWVALASAYRPLFVQPEEGEHFRIVDRRGKEVRAWHFAHFTNDRQKVNELKPKMYGRRFVAITAAIGGTVAFASGLGGVQARRDSVGFTGGFDAETGLFGALAVAGLFTAVVIPVNAASKRHEWERVDTHYSREEAIRRIRKRAEVWATPTGMYARF